MDRKGLFCFIVVTLIFCSVLLGCGGGGESATNSQIKESNSKPEVYIEGDVEVLEQTYFTLDATVKDNNSSIVSYEWSHDTNINFNTLNIDSKSPTFISENILNDTLVNMTVVVTDNNGAKSSNTFLINIKEAKLSEIVGITDSELSKCVNNFESKIEVTELACYEQNSGKINSIDGLENLPNLSLLQLSNFDTGNHIDLSKLEKLKAIILPNSKNLESLSVFDPRQVVTLNLEEQNFSFIDLSEFINLEYLGLSHNPLTEINLNTQKKLKALNIQQTEINELNLEHNLQLKSLSFTLNQGRDNPKLFKELNIGHLINLESVYLDWLYDVTSLDISNLSKLESLSINGMGITTLDLGNAPKLTHLSIRDTKIKNLDFSLLNSLESINVIGVDESSFILSQLSKVKSFAYGGLVRNGDFLKTFNLRRFENLEDLTLMGDLTSLNLSYPEKIIALNLSNNNFSEIDLSELINLRSFDISGNKITALDISNNIHLYRVEASDNHLNSISGIELLDDKDAYINFESNPFDSNTIQYLEGLITNEVFVNIKYSLSNLVTINNSGYGYIKELKFTLKPGEVKDIYLEPTGRNSVGSVTGCGGSWKSPNSYTVGPIDSWCEVDVRFVDSSLPVSEKAGVTDAAFAQCVNNSSTRNNFFTTAIQCNSQEVGTIKSIEGIGSFPSLERLYLDQIQVGSSINLGQTKNLNDITIIESAIDSLEVENKSFVKKLNLNKNDFTDFDLTEYSNLNELNISDNYLNRVNLSNAKLLTKINLNNNNLIEVSGIEFIDDKAVEINLYNNNFNEGTLEYLNKLKSENGFTNIWY